MSALLEAHRAGYAVRGRPLVAEVSLALNPGELTVIVGPNGAGKSTLFRLLSGELAPTSGAVTSFGERLSRVPPWRLACRRAVMAQAAHLAFPFTVHEVVSIGIDGIGKHLGRAAAQMLVEEALATADVGHLADRSFQTLSGGEQQRVHFARALAQLGAGRALEPAQALMLDEPVASLDVKHQLALMDAAIERARAGTAVLAILHDLNLALTYADRLVVMSQGLVVAEGEPAEVVTRELLGVVFGFDLPLSRVPADGRPFILPHHHRSAAA